MEASFIGSSLTEGLVFAILNYFPRHETSLNTRTKAGLKVEESENVNHSSTIPQLKTSINPTLLNRSIMPASPTETFNSHPPNTCTSSSTASIQPSSCSGDPSYAVYEVWVCCWCGDGPFTVGHVAACPNSQCGHGARCSNCPTQYVKYRVGT